MEKSSFATKDGRELRAELKPDYYWPVAATAVGSDGRRITIEPFPVVTALVVSRLDGNPLAHEDELVSRVVAQRYCAERGGRFSDEAEARLSEGAWAFAPACIGNTP